MKKTVIFIALSLCIASSAFAVDPNMDSTGLSYWGAKTGATAASGTNLIGKTSTGVASGLFTASTGYSVVTQHKSGTKAFGSSYDSTAIYSTPVTTVGTAVTGPTSADSALFTGTWTTM